MPFKYSYLAILFLCSFGVLSSQDVDTMRLVEPKIALISKHYGDHIGLRWAPTDAKWWFYGINEGYAIYRKDLSDPKNPYELIIDTLKPWSLERMEEWFVQYPEDRAIALPYQTIYQDWENSSGMEGNFEDLYEKNLYFKQRFETTILTADIYPIVAEAAGLSFKDKHIDPEKMYSYRVEFNYGDYQAAYSVVRQWQIMDRPILHDAIEKENAITLSWDKKLNGSTYTAFYVERSEDGQSFDRLNEFPYVHGVSEDVGSQPYTLFTDHVENYQLYYYRIVGIDPFGDESLPSEVILARGKDRTPPLVTIPKVQMSEDGKSNKIIWSHDPLDELRQAFIYKKDHAQEAKIVYQSDDYAGFSFEVEDHQVLEGMTDYYLVLVDTAGNYAQSQRASLYRKDETPPLAPQNLKAEVDTTGNIILSWDQGPDNDIIGYYIYSADRKYDNFIKLNQEKYPFRIYRDSVNMELLTEKRFYKIAAIDKGGNIGDYSEILEVKRPDKIPPSPALFYDYRVDTAGIFLGLIPSSSQDVAAHRIYRKKAQEKEWEIIAEFDKKPPQLFLDNQVEPNQKYIYKWIAIDDSKLESSAAQSTLHLTAFDTRTTYIPLVRTNTSGDFLKLEFGQTIPGSDYRIQIVRSKGNAPYKTLTTIENAYAYEDRSVPLNLEKDYTNKYKIRILYKDGKRSKFSDETVY